MIADSSDEVSIVEAAVADNSFQRESTLTITENTSPLYNGVIKCEAVWSALPDMSAATSCDVNAIGASMDVNSFSNSDGDGIMTCTVWDDAAPKSFTWTKDGSDDAIVAVTDSVSHP